MVKFYDYSKINVKLGNFIKTWTQFMNLQIDFVVCTTIKGSLISL